MFQFSFLVAFDQRESDGMWTFYIDEEGWGKKNWLKEKII